MILDEAGLKDFCKKLLRSEFEDSECAKRVAIKGMRVVLLALGYDTDFVEDKFRAEVEKAIVVNGSGNYDNFSERLKRLRKNRGLTQKELSDMLGIKQTTYSDWENGKTEPKLGNVVKLAVFFNVPLNWLFRRK